MFKRPWFLVVVFLAAVALEIAGFAWRWAHNGNAGRSLVVVPVREPEPTTYRSGPIACFLVMLLAVSSSIRGSEPKAPKPVTIQRLATAVCGSRIATHVTVSGAVASVRKEADGDYHLSLCEPSGAPCVVVEVIPELSADRIVSPKSRAAKTRSAIRKGDLVEVTGISRWDTGHRWREIHPATRIVVLGRVPSGKGKR